MKSGSIIALIGTIRERVYRFLRHELEAEGMQGLAPSHGAILSHLFVAGELAMTEIARRIDRDRSTVTTLVAKLVDYGYVRRSPGAEDGRVTRIRLTKKGKDIEAAFQEISETMIERTYRGFSDQERSTLTDLLNRVAENWE